jgi:hypothetical protein
MKTSEFERVLEKLGYELKKDIYKYSIIKKLEFPNCTIATINGQVSNKFNVYFQNTKIPNDIRCELFLLTSHFASTPIEEREDKPKLFNVTFVKDTFTDICWLYRVDKNTINKALARDNTDSDQRWTLEQIKEYEIDDETFYKRVPVED